MSAPKAESTRRRKVVKEDEDYVPEGDVPVVKKTKSTKPRSSPFISHVTPYNPRHHDPTIARLGLPTQGTIRNFLLSQVALSTRIITWLHVRHHSFPSAALPPLTRTLSCRYFTFYGAFIPFTLIFSDPSLPYNLTTTESPFSSCRWLFYPHVWPRRRLPLCFLPPLVHVGDRPFLWTLLPVAAGHWYGRKFRIPILCVQDDGH